MPAHLSLAAVVWLASLLLLALRVEFAHQRFRAYWDALGPRAASRGLDEPARGPFPPALEIVLAAWRVQEDPYLERARRRLVRRWCELLAVGLLAPALVFVPPPLRDWLLSPPRA